MISWRERLLDYGIETVPISEEPSARRWELLGVRETLGGLVEALRRW